MRWKYVWLYMHILITVTDAGSSVDMLSSRTGHLSLAFRTKPKPHRSTYTAIGLQLHDLPGTLAP